MKPLEEKVIHRQKAWLSVKDGGELEERGQGYVKVIKHLKTGQMRLEMRGAQYGEVCPSQQLDRHRFKVALDDSSGKKSVFGFFKNISAWYYFY